MNSFAAGMNRVVGGRSLEEWEWSLHICMQGISKERKKSKHHLSNHNFTHTVSMPLFIRVQNLFKRCFSSLCSQAAEDALGSALNNVK